MENKNKKKINRGIYVNKLLILDHDVLLRICSKENGDKIVNPFLRMSTEKMQRRWTEESVAAG